MGLYTDSIHGPRDRSCEPLEIYRFIQNAQWFSLFPEYVEAPKAVILDAVEDNEGHPFAINVDVIVGSERYRYMRAGSPLKRRSEVNQDGNFGGFTGMPDDDTIKKVFKDSLDDT